MDLTTGDVGRVMCHLVADLVDSVEVAIVSNVGNVQLRRLALFMGARIVERAHFRNYPPLSLVKL